MDSYGRAGIDSTYISSSIATVYPNYLAYLDFSGAPPIRLWTGLENKVFTDFSGSAEYSSVGTFGSISAVSETTDVTAKGIDLTLSGIPSSYLALALTGSFSGPHHYRGRTAAVYLVLMNATGTPVQQTMIFRGRMDQMIINEGDTNSSITIKCESRLVDLNRPRERRYTDEYQKAIVDPNDTALEFMASMAGKSLYWGRSAPSTYVNYGGGGGGEGDGGLITPP